MHMAFISSQEELETYQREKLLVEALEKGLALPKLASIRIELDKVIDGYLQERRFDEKIEWFIFTPTFRLAWPVLFGISLILRETLQVATSTIATFLPPINLAMDGVRNIWDLYRTARNPTINQRKTLLAITSLQLVLMSASAVMLGLSMSPPMMMTLILFTVMLSQFYKESYLLYKKLQQVKKIIQKLKEVETLPDALIDHERNRLTRELSITKLQLKESYRKLTLASVTLLAAGLVVSSAVVGLLSLSAAPVLATLGVFILASVIFLSILTSPVIRDKIIKLMNGGVVSSVSFFAPPNVVESAAPLPEGLMPST